MDKRILVSTGIALVFVLAWQFVLQPLFFPAKKPGPPAVEEAKTQGAPTSTPATKPVEAPQSRISDHPEAPPIVLESGTHRLTLTNKGAGIRELVLKYPPGEGSVVLLSPHAGAAPHGAFRLDGSPERIEALGWEVVETSPSSATFLCRLPSGIELRKTFALAADGAGPSLKLTLRNPGSAPAKAGLELLALNGLDHDTDYRYDQYAAGYVNVEKHVKVFPLHQIASGEEKLAASRTGETAKEREEAFKAAEELLKQGGGQKSWFGLKNRFFAAAVEPDAVTAARIESIWFRKVPPALSAAYGDRQNATVSARFDAISVEAGKEETWTLALRALPLKHDALKVLPGGGELLNYGGGCASGCGPLSGLFGPMVFLVNQVAPLILGVLAFLAGLFGNHGVAIIATTLAIRLVLFPLSRKSQVSMYRMQQLGPKISALRERYKDDQQKFGTEQMRLFREHKINPLSGCFPVLLQMPIFIAMYSVFELSVELRREPFFLWIKDLSQPDHLLTWAPMHINILITSFTLDALNLLPIVMTITWFLQSYFAPRSPDPQMAAQQKMMMFMPVMFGLMCYNLASGLSLYFLVNSLLSMSEQKLIKKFFLPREETPKTA